MWPTWRLHPCSCRSDLSSRFEIVAETGSTNADLIARIARGEAVGENFWLIADRQLHGRGRQGREWIDGEGNFMGSTLVRLGPLDPPAASLSFLAAMALYEALLPHLARPQMLQLKWPNDVLLAGAKVAGILLERHKDNAIIGVGVNLATAPNLAERRTGALADAGALPARDAFAHDLAASFARELERWRHYGTDPLFTRWLSAAHPVGTPLAVHQQAGVTVAGIFDGLAPDGALRLRLDDGSSHVVHAGDVMLETR